MLRGAAESVAGALFGRAGQRTVQHRGSGEIEWLAVVPQAPGALTVLDKPRSWSKRVAVVTEPSQYLAGVRETRLQSLQGANGSGQRPAESGRELLRGARLLEAREQRLDGTVIGGAMPVEVVDRAASGIAGAIGVLAGRERAIDALGGKRTASTCGWLPS